MMALLITVMSKKKYNQSCLSVGTLIKDKDCGDLALLTKRVNLFEKIDEQEPVWFWEMVWTGPTTNSSNRNVPFVEEAILGLLNSGDWEIKNGTEG